MAEQADWQSVDGYVALKMMDAMTRLAELQEAIKNLRMSLCLDHRPFPHPRGAIKICAQLKQELEAVEYRLMENQEERKKPFVAKAVS